MTHCYVPISLLLSVVCALTAEAQFCPVLILPRDRDAVKEEIIAPVLLELANMHELALQVASDTSLSLSQINAFNELYKLFLNRIDQDIALRPRRLHWRTQNWLREASAVGFSSLAKSNLGGDSLDEARANAVVAARLVNSMVSQIARCF